MAFAALPGIPQSGLSPVEFQLFASVKENIEQLTGQSGVPQLRAVLTGQVGVVPIEDLNSKPVSITGASYIITGGGPVPSQEDFVSLATTVQQLVYDVQLLRDTLNTLIIQLRG